jgi:hypothetical protein
MTTAFIMPLANTPQTLTITLNGITYNMRVVWNQAGKCWIADFYDSNNVPILLGAALVTGDDLLECFGYLGIGDNAGQLIVQTASNTDAVPTFDNLGTDGNLFYVLND